jgi:hypothetical protein
MKSITATLHAHSDGTYALSVTLWEDGQDLRSLLHEESRPMPEVTVPDAWRVASQMTEDALRALEPSPGLWSAPIGAGRSD